MKVILSSTIVSATADLYCPSVDDLTVAYCNNATANDCPVLMNQGWTISRGGGAASKSAFNLNGGYVEFDMDLSETGDGVNANIYTISPPKFELDHFNKTLDYCDGQGSAGSSGFCMEIDWVEANGNCGGATTIHTVAGPGSQECTAWGCATDYKFNGKTQFHMRIEYDEDGVMTTLRNGEVMSGFNPDPSSTSAWSDIKTNHEERGAVIYSSEWVGWVPVSDCGSSGSDDDLQGSSYTISNLIVSGSVVQGPVPASCGPAPSAPPAPTPAPTPTTTPTPTPPTPTPSPQPTPAPPAGGKCCWGGCSGDCHSDTYCDASENQCSDNCSGQWCAASFEVVV